MEAYVGKVVVVGYGDSNRQLKGIITEVDLSKQRLTLQNVSERGIPVAEGPLNLDALRITSLTLDDTIESSTQNRGKKTRTRNNPNGRQQRQQLAFNNVEDDASSVADFDFAGNLALFDKQEVFAQFADDDGTHADELLVTHNLRRGVEPKLGIHEMVLSPKRPESTEPPAGLLGDRYETEHSVPVPAVTWEQMKYITSAADNIGLSRAQLEENGGTAVCQIVVDTLGGSRRINHTTRHQPPQVLILIGDSHSSGFGLCSARHLANRSINVTVFMSRRTLANLSIHGLAQFKSFEQCGGTLLSNTSDLPRNPVDVVIDALGACDPDDVEAISWFNSCRCTRIALEYPAGVNAITGHHGGAWSKPTMCIAFGLPKVGRAFSESCPELYLADLGLPKLLLVDRFPGYDHPYYDKSVVRLNAA
eukprot:m.116763 g.116763  ORF g.116763 m.116763 type:complete len:420 (+) comp28536_c0_seq2:60-1319(+)